MMTLADIQQLDRETWYQELVGPIRQAVYLDDITAARTAITAALDGLANRDLDAELREVLDYRMAWYSFVVETLDREDEELLAESYQRAIDRVTTPAGTTFGDYERRRVLAILRSIEYEYARPASSREEIEQLIEGLPGIESDEFLWHALAGWAFINGDKVILTRAFEVHLTQPSSELGQAKWQRVNMMYQLVTGKATRRDVAETIQTLMVLPQLMEFIELIWPCCVEQGLVDGELEQKLEEKIKQIDVDIPPVPSRERKTKSIRNR